MGAIYLLDKAYAATDSGGIAAHRVVVASTNAGECKLPTVANGGAIMGVTVHAVPAAGRSVAVRKQGIALVVAAGAISYGVPVNIADTQGRVKAISETAGTAINCLGFAETAAASAGDLIEVFIAPHQRTA